ncbi:MAG: CHAT domain-containing protein, partial [Planctomycetes bacterium]|nr:CHAT domain-containing protein [Planctomycetota bacterium]
MDLVGRMIHLKGFVRAVESFNKERATSEVLEAEMPERIRRNRERLRFPVSVLAPGLPSIYLRRTGEERPNQAKSEPAELEAFSFLSTHRAIARSGLGFVTPPVPQQLFNKIDQLEVHVLEARPNGLKILKMLRGIGLDAAALIPQEAVLSLRRAGDVTIFSNFPLGLSILGGHTSPLCCSRPVWYRPLLPLTSAMQMEVNPPDGIYLGHSMRVLVLDCLQPDDPVRTMCSAGWHAIKTLLSGVKSSSFAQVNVRTEDEFRAALLANPSEILILCAHGQYLRDANSASVVIGDVPTQLTNLEGLPPVVLLSSCATSPRGVGAVSVADLLLRGGALAVISTLIPILASRNALLMMRFFEYLSLAVSGKAPLRTLADVWQATASTNALFDILTTSDRIATWAREPHANGDVVSEFMIRSAKRVRMTHLYEDTQLILEEIARDRGFLDVLRSTLKSQGFLPETLFYTMLGWPERIIVRDDVVERMNGRA